MYGIVNKAIEELVVEIFGAEKWQEVKQHGGIDIDFFLSNQSYSDEVTFKLATSVAAVMGMTVDSVLIAFGEWWVLRTGREKYGKLLEAGGASVKEFLVNLPMFHNRLFLIYPQLSPPEFRITDITERGVHVHYFSKRGGLHEFVRGLLQGIGKMYQTPVTVSLLESRLEGKDHEVFQVNW